MGVTLGSALLDTSVVIALLDEGRRFELSGFERLVVSSITYAELRMGIACARTPESAMERYQTLEEVNALFGEGLAFDDEAAMIYGRIVQAVAARGGGVRAHANDRMIAATAAAHSLPLLTLDGADLTGLEREVQVLALE
ncbi:PIN domain-containing protein [Brevibacterium album]|uniref:PIN domain-containing protein n=1 Tax=Brevibacterium album TaxID=417948 RepID=UPI0006853555|nr:PIN domain-containing protein [Brevibacterium album]